MSTKLLITCILSFYFFVFDLFSQSVNENIHFQQLCKWTDNFKIKTKKINDSDSTFLSWITRTGEKLPNFDSLPANPFLPDPLIDDSGNKITTIQNWNIHANTIRKDYLYWITGQFPKRGEYQVNILSNYEKNNINFQWIELCFGNEKKARISFELIIPKSIQKLPVFMTQINHRGWAQIAVQRGYMACIYNAADKKDDTYNYGQLFPDYDFSVLMQRAWSASWVLDYLHTLNVLDTNKIAICGHSRNGKQSLYVAAFDKRIDAVISSSAGTGGDIPFRYTDKRYDNETIDKIMTSFPQWFSPRLRFFVGREQYLPVDQNLLLACIAPAALGITSAINETQCDPWASQQSYNSAKKVYDLMNIPNKIELIFREGEHGTSARDIEDYIDFFDRVFGRKNLNSNSKNYYTFDFEVWKNSNNNKFDSLKFNKTDLSNYFKVKDWEVERKNIFAKIHFFSCFQPNTVEANDNYKYNPHETDDFVTSTSRRVQWNTEKIKNMIIGPYEAMGNYLWANLYMPANQSDSLKKLPVVIYLHEYDHCNGYGGKNIKPFVEKMTEKGIAVLAFDMIGFGTRLKEYENFYNRYPKWSIGGKMIDDVQSAVDLVSKISYVDSSKIYISGYALGGYIGLISTALDYRVKGVVSISGFTPLRTENKSIEGIAAYSHLHGIFPALGFYKNKPMQLPLDFDEILATIAPRKIFVINPKFNRHAESDKIEKLMLDVEKIYKLYKSENKIKYLQPDTYDQFSQDMMEKIAKWILEEN